MLKIRILVYAIFLFLFSSLTLVNSVNATVTKRVMVSIDGQVQQFETEPVMVNGRILVPVLSNFENIETSVIWNKVTQSITLLKHDIMISLEINNNIAMVNEKTYELDVPPIVINNQVYIPLRFIAEALDLPIFWKPENRSVEICYRSCMHKLNIPTTSQIAQKIAIQGIKIGDTIAQVTSILGNYHEQLPSQYDFEWYIYHEDYKNYLQVGIDNEVVVAFYTNGNQFSINSISGNSTKEEVRAALGTPITSILKSNRSYQYNSKEEWDLFLLNDSYYVTIFYDLHAQNKVTAIQMIKKEFEISLPGYYGLSNQDLKTSYERQMLHLVNATRVKSNLQPLIWNNLAAHIAKNHSEDMAINNYFDHYNLEGKSPFERMRENGLDYRYAGENLAVGQFSAIFAHEGLMNSYGHRKNILNANFQFIGVGVSFSGNRPFFTQNYVTP